MQRKAVLKCVVCDSATTDPEKINEFYSHKKVYNNCPVCCTLGNTMRIELVSHDEYMKIKAKEAEERERIEKLVNQR